LPATVTRPALILCLYWRLAAFGCNQIPTVGLQHANDFADRKPRRHLDSQLHPLVEPHVSHFSQVPFRTMVKLWHSEHSLPV
jgi:hypothetical protein